MRYLLISAVAKRLLASANSKRLIFQDVLVGLYVNFRQLFDALTVSETIAKNVGKSVLEESQTVSDSASINFGLTASQEFVQVSESIAKLSGKSASDTLSSVDSGTLLNQDYVDNPYYFADDYVGSKRIF